MIALRGWIAGVVAALALGCAATCVHATDDTAPAAPAGAPPPAASDAATPADPAAPEAAPNADPVAPPFVASWDRAGSIRGAAQRIAILQRTKGPKAAYTLIDNCYRTHVLAETYSEGFENCITQDYLQTKMLIELYSRMTPEALAQLGGASPQMLAETMRRRIGGGLKHYGMPQTHADDLKKLVDQHGLPVFLSIVFPEAVQESMRKQQQDKKDGAKPDDKKKPADKP